MKRSAMMVLLAAGILALAGAASAASIGVSFHVSGRTDAILAPDAIAGVVAQENWNNWLLAERWGSATPNPSLSSAKDSSGSSTAMSASLSLLGNRTTYSYAATHMWWQLSPSLTTGDNRLMGCGEDGTEFGNSQTPPTTAGDEIQLSLAKVPYQHYDLIIYVGHHNSIANTSVVDLGFSVVEGPSLYVRTSGFDGTFTESKATSASALPTVGAADYVRFTGLTGDVTVLMSQLYQQSGNANQGGGWSGFQIVEVPEPATMSLLAIGGVTALLRRRRSA
ncbi:MAG: PEP-CTERM sorting domain-containing protein [Planctomycetaceae bacterium]|nr:PEP-CTERM sorting domain-containing protein [Planctomycetaceae bacterium]